ncbi:Peroxisomal membrane signal receptor PTS1 [Chytridiales sp. JEL 0842]|nr:Peroxisomal membrane signal receptor PTS1 [Chytridiales sp. JEL 0842]
MIAGPSTRPTRTAEFNDSQFVNEFLNPTHHHGMHHAQPPQGMREAFQFNDMKGELEGMLERQGGPMNSDWAADFERFEGPAGNGRDEMFEAAFKASMAAGRGWGEEFALQQSLQQTHVGGPELEQFERAFAEHVGPAITEEFDKEWSAQFSAIENLHSVSSKGKEKLVELDDKNWEEEFAQFSDEVKEGKEWNQQLDEVWKELADKDPALAAALKNKSWQEEFDEDYMPLPGSTLDPDPVTAPCAPYTFETENPYLAHANPMAEGMRIMEAGGNLSAAALAFEAAVQREPENSDAWMMLGRVQAENEKEEPAIAALQRSVQENPKNLPALLSLGISYTNEGQYLQAYASLNRWITTKYPSLSTDQTPAAAGVYNTTDDLHDKSSKLFIEAVRRGPEASAFPVVESKDLDPDVQVGLGVLFYMKGEYNKAIDCFSSALTARPKDYLLWNRLGATLANSGRSEEAIDAYDHALEIRPSFVRCRYNLGVAFMNIGGYKEAAEHMLGALSMHVVGDDPSSSSRVTNVSENLWETLRRTFLQMDRRDLADMTYQDRDVNKFRKDFDF